MMTSVIFHGALGTAARKPEWELDVMSPGEAIRAVNCQVGGALFRHLIEKDKEGVQYRVVVDGEDVAGQRPLLVARLKHYRRIEFVPVPAGAGLGIFELIAGVVLVVAGILLSATGFGVPLIVAGIGLLASGVIATFFGPKPPVTAAHQASDRGDTKDGVSSYLFNGPVNTVAQGGAVPLLYGRMIVGSQVISSSIHTASLTLAGDSPGSDAYLQALYDSLNMGTIPDKTNRG